MLQHILGARPSSPPWPVLSHGPRPLVFGAVAVLVWLSTFGCSRTENVPSADRTQKADEVEPSPDPGDLDGDGLDDALEDALAERFAPIVFHGERESTFPTNVDRWLSLTNLYFADEDGTARLVAGRPLQQAQLPGHAV